MLTKEPEMLHTMRLRPGLPQTFDLVLSGPLRGREGERKERERKGKGGDGQEERGRGGEGRLTLMRSWNGAADWLRPALS